MSEFRLTPLEMEMLLHFYCRPTPFETPANADLVSQSLRRLHDAGLIDRMDFPSTTDKGRAWVERALSTPLPVQKWVWE